MLLKFANGRAFARGAIAYNTAPGTETSSRIILELEIGGQLTTAFVDTGLPCSVCSPDFAHVIGLASPMMLPVVETAILRGKEIRGRKYIANATLLANAGDYLHICIPIFVPDTLADFGEDLIYHSFLGMQGCLGSILLAIDTVSETFYFG